MRRAALRPRPSPWLAATLLVCSVSPPALAQSSAQLSVPERLSRLERVLDSNTLVELLQRVERLQSEVQNLRGEVEVQTHSMNQLKKRQRELYLDIDKRMQQLEATRAAAPAPPSTASADVPPGASGEPAFEASAGAVAAPSAAADTRASTYDPVQEQADYQQAFDLLKAARYERAVTAFQSFLADYPGGRYADNAQYWLGEAFYVSRRFESAMTEFGKLVGEYPESQKFTHALLKIGYIHDELGQRQQAETTLEDLIARYPETTAAQLARERLQRIRSRGT